uniref:LIM zinc-binding domain-containing protein n=1 Tax=Schizophyllum commune (strain H4-8 / FGSC 9210) TaxID=578458 RepID=D8QHA0_SCHCM
MEYVHSITNYLGLTHDNEEEVSKVQPAREDSIEAKDAYGPDEDEDDLGWKLRGGPTKNAVSGTSRGGRPKCPDFNRGKCASRCPKGLDHLSPARDERRALISSRILAHGFLAGQQRAQSRGFVPATQQQTQQPAGYAQPHDSRMYQQQPPPQRQPPQNAYRQLVEQQQARLQQYKQPLQRQPGQAAPAGNQQPRPLSQGFGQSSGFNNAQRPPFRSQQSAGSTSQPFNAARTPSTQPGQYFGQSQPATSTSPNTQTPMQRMQHGYSNSTPNASFGSQPPPQRGPPISPSAIRASQSQTPSVIAPSPQQVPLQPQQMQRGRPLPPPRRADTMPPVQPASSFGGSTPQRAPAMGQNRNMFPPPQAPARSMSTSPAPMTATHSMPSPTRQMSRSPSPAPPAVMTSPSRGSRPLPVPTPGPSRVKHQSLDISRLPSVSGLPKSSFDGIPIAGSPPGNACPVSPRNFAAGLPDIPSQASRSASRSPSPTKAQPVPPPLPPRQSPTKSFSDNSATPRSFPPPLPPRQSPTKEDTESVLRRRESPPKFDLMSSDPPSPEKPGSPTKFVPLWKQRQRTFAAPPVTSSQSAQPPQPSPKWIPSLQQSFHSQPSQRQSYQSQPSQQSQEPPSPSAYSSQFSQSPSRSGRPLPAPNGRSFPGPPTERSASPAYSSEEEDESEASEESGIEPPSPGYGIRDLPRNSQAPPLEDYYDYTSDGGSSRKGSNFSDRGRLPYPPQMARSLPGRAAKPPEMTRMAKSAATGDTASMTLRFAALGMDDNGEQTQQRGGSGSGLPQPPQMPAQRQPIVPAQQHAMQTQQPVMHAQQPVTQAQWTMMQAQSYAASRSRSSSPAKRIPGQWDDLDDLPPPPSRSLPQPQSPRVTTHSPLQFRRTPPASSSTSSMTVESPSPRDGRNALPKINLPDDGDEDFSGGPSIQVSPAINVEPPSISVNGPPSISVNGPPSISINAPSITFDPPQINVDPPSISVSGAPSINVSAPAPVDPTVIPVIAYGGGIDEPPTPRKLPKDLPPVIRRGGLACGGCGGAIIGRIVNAMGVRWHPGCFRCTVCNELLEHVSSYEKDGRPYCHLDYHENFAPRCYTCKTAIIEERFISLDDPALGKRNYHEQHFFCAECGDPFLTLSGGLPTTRAGELSVSGDGTFDSGEGVGFTVYRGHPYCENCHVRLRMPKCKRCKKSIREHTPAVEALGGKWCYECFVCAGCDRPFEDPSFFEREGQPYCEHCYMVLLRNDL